MASRGTGHTDPGRRERILGATLDVIADEGLARTTHRRVAERADVPLGSMTYHFTSLSSLHTEAFAVFTADMSVRYDEVLARADTAGEAVEAVVDIISGDLWRSRRAVSLMLQLYVFTLTDPAAAALPRTWMVRSRQALERHFDSSTARNLDVMIEGFVIQNYLGQPADPDDVRAAIQTLVGDRS